LPLANFIFHNVFEKFFNGSKPHSKNAILLGYWWVLLLIEEHRAKFRLLDQSGCRSASRFDAKAPKPFVTEMGTLPKAISLEILYAVPYFGPNAEAGMGHIELAKWADFNCPFSAPASADFMGTLPQAWQTTYKHFMPLTEFSRTDCPRNESSYGVAPPLPPQKRIRSC